MKIRPVRTISRKASGRLDRVGWWDSSMEKAAFQLSHLSQPRRCDSAGRCNPSFPVVQASVESRTCSKSWSSSSVAGRSTSTARHDNHREDPVPFQVDAIRRPAGRRSFRSSRRTHCERRSEHDFAQVRRGHRADASSDEHLDGDGSRSRSREIAQTMNSSEAAVAR